MVAKCDRKNVRMSLSALKLCRPRQYVTSTVGDAANVLRICSSILLVKKNRRGSRCSRNARPTMLMKIAIICLSSHSSRASTTITIGGRGGVTDWIGSTISFKNCRSYERWMIWLSCCRAFSMYGLVAGIESAILYAIVEIKWVIVLRRPDPLKKKKLAQSLLEPSHRWATVLAIADFPPPAAPFNQHTGQSLLPSIHLMIFPMISRRVFSKHPETPRILSYMASGTGSSSRKSSKCQSHHGKVSMYSNSARIALYRTWGIGVDDGVDLVPSYIIKAGSISAHVLCVLEHRHRWWTGRWDERMECRVEREKLFL